MENAANSSASALSPHIPQGTLKDIFDKMMFYSNKIAEATAVYRDSDELSPEVFEYVDAMRHYQLLYNSIKDRVDRQVAFQAEMKSRIVLKIDKRQSKEWTPYLLITLNPRPFHTESDIRRFVSMCAGFFRSYVFDLAEYVFEQRGKNEGDYNGVHCHAIVHRCHTPHKVKEEIKRHLTDSGLFAHEKHIDVRNIDSKSFEARRNYLIGEKKGKDEADRIDKRAKQANDVLFRRDFGLDAVYTSGGS